MHHESDPRTQAPHRLIVPVLMTLIVLGVLIAFGTPASNSAADTSATPFAYLPLVANAGTTVSTTPTRMPTTIPTTTNTPTMQTLPCNSVYPIAIKASLLDANGFVPPTDPGDLAYYGLYSDGTYSNKTERRLYLYDGGAPALDFLFLAWRTGDATIISFSVALTGTGTLYQGFDEVVPWPDTSSTAPEGYPLAPHQLTVGDWITVFVSEGADQRVFDALNNHIIQRTVLSLPIYDKIVANGAAESVHFVRLGTFLLRGYYLPSTKPHLDLVYLGDAAALNCNSAATATPNTSFTVTPRFVTLTPTPTKTDTPTATTTSTPTSTPTP